MANWLVKPALMGNSASSVKVPSNVQQSKVLARVARLPSCADSAS